MHFERLELEAMRKLHLSSLSEMAPKIFFDDLKNNFCSEHLELFLVYTLLLLFDKAKDDVDYERELISETLDFLKGSENIELFMEVYIPFTVTRANESSNQSSFVGRPIEYLRQVMDMLTIETKLVERYFEPKYKKILINIIQSNMVRNHALELVKVTLEEIRTLLDQNDMRGLTFLYDHMKTCPDGAHVFRGHYRKCLVTKIAEQARKINDSSDYYQGMCALIMLEFDHRANIEEFFDSDADMFHCVNDAFTEAVNLNGEHVALALVRYTEVLLSQAIKPKDKPNEEFITALQNVILFLRHVKERDLFEVKYRKSLLERFVRDQGVIDYERLMVKMLTHEYGKAYTRNIDLMVEGFAQSIELNAAFDAKGGKASLLHSFVLPTITFDQAWKIGGTINMPKEILDAMDNYVQFYTRQGNEKLINFLPMIGIVTISYNLPKTNVPVSLVMDSCLGIALLAFNDSNKLTFLDLINRSGLSRDELYDTLSSLLRSGILISSSSDFFSIEHPFVGEKVDSITFECNPDFEISPDEVTSHDGRVFIHHERIQRIDGKVVVGQKIVEKCLSRDVVLEHAIVRVLKIDRKVTMTCLRDNVAKMLDQPNLNSDCIKARVEALITKDIVKRDEEDPNIVHYIP